MLLRLRDGVFSINEFADHFRYIFDGINTLQGLWVFIIFVCKQNVINLMLVTAGMRESERSKAKSRTTNMQVTFCLLTLNVEVTGNMVKFYIWRVHWDDLFNVYQAVLITLAVVIHLVVLAVMIVPSHFR